MTPNLGLEAGQAAIIPFTNSLNAGRWRQAEGLARIEAAFSTSPEAKAQAQVNIWLARDLALGPQANGLALRLDVVSLRFCGA